MTARAVPAKRRSHHRQPVTINPALTAAEQAAKADAIARDAYVMRHQIYELGRAYAIDGQFRVRVPTAMRLLGVSENTLRNWRADKTGPAWIRRNGRILYTLTALAEWRWLENHAAHQR